MNALPGDVVLLDIIEILFDQRFQEDPLRCLQKLSRGRTVVAAWNGTPGTTASGHPALIFAVPDHPEYRHYAADKFLMVDLQPAPVEAEAGPGRATGEGHALR